MLPAVDPAVTGVAVAVDGLSAVVAVDDLEVVVGHDGLVVVVADDGLVPGSPVHTHQYFVFKVLSL